MRPGRALECVQDARNGGTLRAHDWDLIEQYLKRLIALGIHEPDDLAGRLERRGRSTHYDDEGLAYSFPPGGRRQSEQPDRLFGRHAGPGGCGCVVCGPDGDHVGCASCCPYRESNSQLLEKR